MTTMREAQKARVLQLKMFQVYEKGMPVTYHLNNQEDIEGVQVHKDPNDALRPRVKTVISIDEDFTLLDSVIAGDKDGVLAMIDGGSVDVNARDYNGMTPLHHACRFSQDRGQVPSLQLAAELIKRGADVKAVDDSSWTALHYAASYENKGRNWRLVQCLLDAGALSTALNEDGDMPIDLVEGDKAGEILENAMQAEGVGPDDVERHRKTQERHFAARIKAMKDKNQRDANQNCPIHIAASHGWVKAVEFLVSDDSCDINAQNADGDTALHLAAHFSNYMTVEALLRLGADTTIRNEIGRPAIVLAEDELILRAFKAYKAQDPSPLDPPRTVEPLPPCLRKDA
eukprot:UC4_evm3s228